MRKHGALGRCVVTMAVIASAAVMPQAQDATGDVRTLTGPVSAVAFTPDGKLLVSGGNDGQVKVWDVATGAVVHTIPGKASIKGVAISSDGKQVAFVAEDKVILAEAATARPIRTWNGSQSVLFSRDGSMLVFGDKGASGTIKVWDFAQAKLRDLKGHVNPITGLALSPDGQLLASGGNDNTARIWNLASGTAVHSFSAGAGMWVSGVAFSADGRTLAYGALITEADSGGRAGWFSVKGGRVVLRDVQTGAEIHTIVAHADSIRALAFSPDGRTLVSAGSDNKVKAWDVAGATLRRDFAIAANALEFSPDGSLLACATNTGVKLLSSVAWK